MVATLIFVAHKHTDEENFCQIAAIQALWSAARYRTPVTYVVVDNGQYAILKAFGDSLGLGEGLPGLDLPGLDIAGLARSLGCEAETVERPAELAAALRRGLDAAGPYLVDVMVDRAVAPLLG